MSSSGRRMPPGSDGALPPDALTVSVPALVAPEGEARPEPALADTTPALGSYLRPAEGFDPGQALGERYQVVRLLGRGGMGAVYQVHDRALGKDVALKFVHPELAGTEGVSQLREEVVLAQQVSHPNVCRTYDLEEVGDQWVLKKEYVPGESLAERLRPVGRFTVEEALGFARAIAEGLGAVHAVGIVHRDLKPRNVLVEEGSGRVVLMDFGLARVVERSGRRDEGLSGTPAYMAPEQVRRQLVDGRADLYALGCVLYEMLVGETPFRGETPLACALKQVEEAPPEPRARRPDVPAWLARAVLRLLDKDPGRRPADAREALALLAGPARRLRPGRVAALALGVALVAGAATWLWRAAPRASWRPEVEDLPQVYDEYAGGPVVFSPDGRSIAYASDREDRGRSWRLYVEPLPADAHAHAHAHGPPGQEPYDLRWARDGASLLSVDEEAHVLMRVPLAGGEPVRLLEHVWSVDDCGEGRLLLARRDIPGCPTCSRLTLAAPGGDERELVRLATGSYLRRVRCDRAGQQAFFWSLRPAVSQAELQVMPLAGGAARVVVTGPAGEFPVQFSFAVQERSLIHPRVRHGQTKLWESPLDGAASRQLTSGPSVELAPEVSPDGGRLVFLVQFTSHHLTAIPVAPAGERPRRRLSSNSRSLMRPVVAPDGSEVIVGRWAQEVNDVEVVAYPLTGGGQERLLGRGVPAGLTPDGAEVLALQRGDGGVTRLVALPRRGGPPRLVAEMPESPKAVAAGWDGRVHLSLRRGERFAAASVALAGGAPEEEAAAPWSLVVPLAGGWRLAERMRQGAVPELHLVAPGAPLDGAGARVLATPQYGIAPDGRSIVYQTGHQIRRHIIAGGADELLVEGGQLSYFALSPDGRTVYASEWVGIAHPQLITNFGERPRP